jgi:hypothetical protein
MNGLFSPTANTPPSSYGSEDLRVKAASTLYLPLLVIYMVLELTCLILS